MIIRATWSSGTVLHEEMIVAFVVERSVTGYVTMAERKLWHSRTNHGAHIGIVDMAGGRSDVIHRIVDVSNASRARRQQ